MKEIPCTGGFVTMVDDEDYEWLGQFIWRGYKHGNTSYIGRMDIRPTKGTTKGRQMILMHRLIMDAPKGTVVDHIDGNGLNNQRSNLRIVTHRQNSQNYHINRSSQFPGVSWSKKYQKWSASININNKMKWLGYFSAEIDAFRAYYDEVLSLGQEILDFPYPAKWVPGDTIYLIVGPSGAGKTTLAQYLKALGVPELISHTTRQPRPGEINGHTYHFVSDEEFKQIPMIEEVEYSGNLYGTSKAEADKWINASSKCFAIVNKEGVYAFKSLYGDKVKVIYVWVSLIDLVERLKMRGDPEPEIRKRVKHALATKELENHGIADYIIVNRDLEESKRLLRFYVGVNN